MDYEKFQLELLNQLSSENNECIEFIEKNKETIIKNFGEKADIKKIYNFTNKINDIIVSDKLNLNYELIEDVLKHPYFNNVLKIFRNSDVLVRACRVKNERAGKWLIGMNINPYIQDENGVTALMYATQNCILSILNQYSNDNKCLTLVDKNGENALFYFVRSPVFYGEERQNQWLLNPIIDINHKNNNGETLLIYCAKNDILKPINKYILKNPSIDVNIVDNEGKTAIMYLTERGRHLEIFNLRNKNCNYDYKNSKNQSALSILIKKMYSEPDDLYKDNYYNYVQIMADFIRYQCDFNCSVDINDNTPFMILLLANDMQTAEFCIRRIGKLDLSVKNKYEENATSLFCKLNLFSDLSNLINNITFDYYYRDPVNQNTLLTISAIHRSSLLNNLLQNDPNIINDVNIYNENALIIASKANQDINVETLLKYGIHINHQDNEGNTALHYAVEIGAYTIVKQLVDKNADINLKNKKGISPLDYAFEIDKGKNDLYKMLTQQLDSGKMKKIMKGKMNNKENNTKYIGNIESYTVPNGNENYQYVKLRNYINVIKSRIYNGENMDFDFKNY
ncbi:ankyrin [Piromyces finnis]|uniref:Ankyrin n=1 Tax=Piromyces finnis TaxID=1754191 RepID=A0A1Y1V454_9FUNG|nr:ankyrin [Piromyces finnis]|eukprot:ORX46861.1 ankyrin [Piromyces finnis]